MNNMLIFIFGFFAGGIFGFYSGLGITLFKVARNENKHEETTVGNDASKTKDVIGGIKRKTKYRTRKKCGKRNEQ